VTSRAAQRAEQAAGALDAFLRTRSAAAAPTPEAPPTGAPPTGAPPTDAPPPPAAAPRRGRHAGPHGTSWRLPHPDWLHHRLTVTGEAATVAAFQRAAAGAGTVPWHLDLSEREEDWFHLLANPAHRTLSLQGARILARQLREAVAARHALATARVGHSRACALDLHALVPVPPDILALGPDHPEALGWLWTHWGTTEMLRHVALDPAAASSGVSPPPPGEAVLRLVFWSADWTPWRALEQVRAHWPSLRLDVRPSYR